MSQAPPPGNLGLVDRLLGYADQPWKVVAIIVLVLVGGGGYAVWEQRAQIAQVVLKSYVTPELRVDRFGGISQSLMTDTTADLVLLASVDLPANVVQNIAGRLRGDPSWKPLSRPFPIFSDVTPLNFGQIGAIIAGQVVCWNIVQVDHLLEAAQLDMKRQCVVAVPPITGVLIGSLALAWKQPPGSVSEDTYKVEMTRQAVKLATW